MSVNKGVVELTVVYPYNGVPWSHKNEWGTALMEQSPGYWSRKKEGVSKKVTDYLRNEGCEEYIYIFFL